MTTFPETPMEASAVSDLDSQTAYWDASATTKRFTHPLHTPWLDNVKRNAAILDYGCGYGRTLDALEQQGFDNEAAISWQVIGPCPSRARSASAVRMRW